MAQAWFKKSLSIPIEARGLRVLLVEPDVNYMNHMKNVLEQHSWRVTPMERAPVALAFVYATKFEYDLVIYEIDMPGMDGFRFMETPMSEQVPLILTSWRGEESLVTKAMNQGAQFFLQKPIADQYLADVARHACYHKILTTKGINLKYGYQSPTGPWATSHSTALALAEVDDIATQHVSGDFKAKRNETKLTDLQSAGFSEIEWVKSTNQLGMGFFPRIIHDMGLSSNQPILEQNSCKMQENSCWNMPGIGESPAISNYSPSLLGNYNNKEEVLKNKYSCIIENEEVPKESHQMISQDEIDDETQRVLSYYGYANHEGNQSGLMTQVEASDLHAVEQENKGGIFGGENETFQSFIDHQVEVQMELLRKSFGDGASNKDMFQMLKEMSSSSNNY